MISALIDALTKLSEVKIKPEDIIKLGIVEGKMKSDKSTKEITRVEDPNEKVESKEVEDIEDLSVGKAADIAEEA
jgi:hypothetical protein